MKLFRHKQHTLEHGERAQGIVLEGTKTIDTRGASPTWYLTVRVHFPDGATTEVERRISAGHIADPKVGQVIPMRFDPDDRERVEIDLPALEAAAGKDRDAAIARAEAELSGATAEVAQAKEDFARRHEAELARMTGRAQARITGVELDGKVGELDVAIVTLSVTSDGGGEPWQTRVRLGVTAAGLTRLAPGTTYGASYDPAEPRRVKLDGW